MPEYEFDSPQFDEAARRATCEAFNEAIAAGLPVFFVDRKQGLNVMQQGVRKFEIRWVPGAPAGENYEIVRELTAHAA